MFPRLRFFIFLLILLIGTTAALQAQGTADNVWYAEFYPELYYAGTPVSQTFYGSQLKLYWGFGKPHPKIPSDYFSSRYRHYITLDRPKRYRIVTRGDDGYRVFIDGNLILDQRSGVPLSQHITEIDLAAGRHGVYVEHYEMVGNASLDIQLYPVRNLPLPTQSPTATPAPTTRPSPTVVPTETAVPVDPNAQIIIEEFTVIPNPTIQGGAVTVSWRVRNATTIDITNPIPRNRFTEQVSVYLGPENVHSVAYTLDPTDIAGFTQFDLHASNNVDSETMTINVSFDCTLRWFFQTDFSAESAYGCPIQEAQPKKISEQRFERGWMILFDEIAGDDSVLVFIDGGDIRIFPIEEPAEPDTNLEPPSGRYQPRGTFSGTWQRYRLQTELGWAIRPSATITDTFWQGTAFSDTYFYMFGSADLDTIWIIDQRNFTWLRYKPE